MRVIVPAVVEEWSLWRFKVGRRQLWNTAEGGVPQTCEPLELL